MARSHKLDKRRDKRSGDLGLAPRKAVIGYEAEFNLYVGDVKGGRKPCSGIRRRLCGSG